jgi:hypothetical protein
MLKNMTEQTIALITGANRESGTRSRLGSARWAGAPHTFGNATDETTVILNTFTPDLYVEYFRDLRDMIAGGRALTPRPRSRR